MIYSYPNLYNKRNLFGFDYIFSYVCRRSEAVGSRGRSQCSKTYKVLISPLDQQLPQMHPYSQPTMPLAHFANMISYPLMPQNYPYMPSAFQQTYAGNSSYHQQLAALLPQYKTNLSPSSLPQSATAPASAYGFGNSTNVGSAGNFPINQQQSAPTGYEDVLSSQYKESNNLLALQHQQQQVIIVSLLSLSLVSDKNH